MVISEHLLLKYDTRFPGDLIRADPGRIAAQAITGMGFLGAGVIIHHKDSIPGLTTAACMWVVCAIGLTVGAGYYSFGSIATGITLFALTSLKIFAGKLSRDWYKEMVIVSEDIEGQVGRIQEVIDKYNIKVSNFSLRKDMQKKEMTVNFKLRLRTVQPDRDILKEVFKIDGIKRVDLR